MCIRDRGRAILPPRIGEDEKLALRLWLRTEGEEKKADNHEEVVEKVQKAMAHAKEVVNKGFKEKKSPWMNDEIWEVCKEVRASMAACKKATRRIRGWLLKAAWVTWAKKKVWKETTPWWKVDVEINSLKEEAK
eukprot:923823-Prorocentrum_lima.AAC.1